MDWKIWDCFTFIQRLLLGCQKTIALSLTVSLTGVILGNQRAIAQSPLLNPPLGEFPIQEEFNIPDAIEQITPRPPSETPLPVEPPSTPPPPILEPQLEEPPQTSPSSPVLIRVNRIEIRGNTRFEDEIAELTQQLENRDVLFEELVALRSAITSLYTSQGYITSGAFLLNNQDLARGIVQIQVVEGELEAIQIEGLNRLNTGYVRSRLQLAGQTPLNQRELEHVLQLLQVDPLLQRVNAELTAGSAPGRSILRVALQETPPLDASIGTNNYQPNSIGSAQLSLAANYTNLLGWGDRLTAQYGRTEGLNLYDISYSIPINPQDGSLTLRYNTNDSRIIEEAVEELDIRSNAETWSLEVRQPLSRSVTQEFALGLGLDVRRSQTYILGDRPFSFSIGAENGESSVTVLRFFQDWVNRGRSEVIAARSQVSIGLDALGATVNDIGTDGRFIKWLGQFQWAQRLPNQMLILTRFNAQLTPDSLLSLERIGLGGQDTIRGYAQNQVVSDNAIWGSLEARFPLSPSDRLTLISFLDAGHAWNNKPPEPLNDFLIGIGIGLRWQALPNLSFGIDYGLPLTNVESRGNSLQDNGIYLSLRYFPF